MKSRNFLIMVLSLVAMALLASCGTATTTASCGFIVGTGQSGYDAKVHQIIYPGQRETVKDGEAVSYVPCNSRNYIINDGSVKGVDGKAVGDRNQLIQATTNTGVQITVAVRALWTLNQSPGAMSAFYTVCLKYKCATGQDKGGDSNFSTPGWNGMLAENFGPALDIAARKAAINVNDSIWQRNDPAEYEKMATAMSAAFSDAVRANLGYSLDLFCGSGNSAWPDPNNPGSGKFVCSPVRIVVDHVKHLPPQQGNDQSSEGAKTVNAQRLANAEALYGPRAAYWLGLQDTIEKCKGANTPCVFNIGDSGGVPVSVPVARPTPAPAPTAAPAAR